MSTNLGFIKNTIVKHPVKTFSVVGAASTAAIWGLYTPYSMSKDNKSTSFAINEFKEVIKQSNNKRDLIRNCVNIQKKLEKQFKITPKKAKFVLSSTIETIKNSKETNKAWLNSLDLSKKDQLIKYIDDTQNDFNGAYNKAKKFTPIVLTAVGLLIGAGVGAGGGALLKFILGKVKSSKAQNVALKKPFDIKI